MTKYEISVRADSGEWVLMAHLSAFWLNEIVNSGYWKEFKIRTIKEERSNGFSVLADRSQANS